MGKRRARTGPGGAVVSSLSRNTGGTVNAGSRAGKTQGQAPGGRRGHDSELHELANPSENKPWSGGGRSGPSSSLSNEAASNRTSLPSSTTKWLGKSPQQMLREWCTKNNRKRPYFSKMAGSEGLVRCTIPAGRKDGRKAKGSAFNLVVGVGDHPGEEFAALNVLHQVERGKPLERLLAPELRSTWLDLDRRFEEVQKDQQRKTTLNEARKAAAERRAKSEKSKESGAISISAASRQLIEDALIEQKAAKSSSGGAGYICSPNADEDKESTLATRKQLIDMGFSEFDAVHASRIHTGITSAIDYLCLNLDESELPPSFAPKSDIEIVHFRTNGKGHGLTNLDSCSRKKLANRLCLSQNTTERVLRESDGELWHAVALMYNILTHNVLSRHILIDSEDTEARRQMKARATEERSSEGEAITAIYGTDVSFGVGVLPGFSDRWTAILRIEGVPGIPYNEAVRVAFVDTDGLYPLTAPMVLVHSDFHDLPEKKHILSPSHRRLLMRAAAGEVARLRQGSQTDEHCEVGSISVPIVHAVLSFFSSATKDELLSSASLQPRSVIAPNSVGVGLRPSFVSKRIRGSSLIRKDTSSRAFSAMNLVQPFKKSPALEAMRQRRRCLPANTARSEIIKSIVGNQVTVISGATGSGKTTQVPQFLLEEASETQLPVFMICTQPRRIAAISVAERVAAERCEQVGGTVGYQVKLNSKVSSRTRLVFCTTGVLLRRLQGDPELDSVSHVFVDEVHERSVETDFLLLLLREILKKRPTLRVVLMSATLDARKFSTYFVSTLIGQNRVVPIISIPGRTFPVEELYLSDAVQLARYQLKRGGRYAKKIRGKLIHHGKYGPEPNSKEFESTERLKTTGAVLEDEPSMDGMSGSETAQDATNIAQTSSIYGGSPQNQSSPWSGSATTVRDTVSLIDESQVNIDLIELLVKRIDVEQRSKKQGGAILVFLPGAAEISAVIHRLSNGMGADKLWPLPLHSLLSPQEQSKAFQRPPMGKRKVICATNIAETSVTVEDVTIVIDTMRAKEISYDAFNGSSMLQECFISKAAARQRAGRAGRVSKGTCYRLVREHTFTNRIAAQQTPEIMRVGLEHLVLNVLSIVSEEQENGNPHSFLASAIDPPDPQAITMAITNLVDIGALEPIESCENSNGRLVRLTALGKHLSGLPVDARIGKLLIYGSVFRCIDAVLTIAATVSEGNPFLAPFDKREEARAAREPLVWGKSDLLTYVKAFDSWTESRRNGSIAEKEFCARHFLSRKVLHSISASRKQLANALADAGFGPCGVNGTSRGWECNPEMNTFRKDVRVLRAVACAALYPNIARIDLPDTMYREVAGGSIAKEFVSKQLKLRAKTGERLFLHPESVNFLRGNYETRWLAYSSKIKTSKLFIRDTTMVSPYAILLFGGEIMIHHQKGQLSVDDWVIFKAPARVAVLARELRSELDHLLLRKFEDANIDISEDGRAVSDVIIRLITTES